jgi:ribosome-binding protein aMBF1 (putative translation factor)
MATRHTTKRAVLASDLIRQAIAESGLSFIELERRTGVKRQCLMKFARAEQSLRLDIAEKLFDTLGLELVKKRKAT